ncbi:hypothetical protein F5Y15DRAFT_186155 [Xylariaceae sp. FL0016]|nr:hypothetical protein F5Y15DRAFT_186155 [Xylariaceae sp. FL0016]
MAKEHREIEPDPPTPNIEGIPLQYAPAREKGKTGNDAQQGESPAYVLCWAGTEVIKEALNSAEELQVMLNESKTERHLFIIHGLPSDYVNAIKNVCNIDQHFLDAHVRRQTYRPSGRRKDEPILIHYDYPELVESFGVESVSTYVGGAPDLTDKAPQFGISNMGDGAVFCRASLYMCHKANFLFLDRSKWKDPASGMRKKRTQPEIQTMTAGSTVFLEPFAPGGDNEQETPTLESLFIDSISHCWSSDKDAPQLLEDIAIRQWFDLFDAIDPNLPFDAATMGLYWQIQASLERNLAASRFLERSGVSCASIPDWKDLLDRPGRRTSLLGQLNPRVATIQLPPQFDRPAEEPVEVVNADLSKDSNRDPASQENQRSLDRVTYLGGVLLPFSIISGILAIDNKFGPTGNMFWVFWVVSVPLTIFTLLVIYADSIRKAEVWIEVAHSDFGKHSSTPSTPRLEEGIPYSASEPIGIPQTRINDPGEPEPDDGAEPIPVVERLFPDTKATKWKKEQLGWAGACATIFRLYKLKKGKRPR